jgi:osmotically-inducible protein OsmY
MLRGLLRLLLVAIIVIAAGAFFFGYWSNERITEDTGLTRPIGTAGERATSAAERSRERGSEIGSRAGAAIGEIAGETKEALSDAGLTAKIKSKMALDDVTHASRIDVDTSDRVVTLRGTVASVAERERAVRLAQETEGVRSVRDELRVR